MIGLTTLYGGSFYLAINETENDTRLTSNQPTHILNLQFDYSYKPDNISTLTKLLFYTSGDYQGKLNRNSDKIVQDLQILRHNRHVSLQKWPFHSLVMFIWGNWSISLIISWITNIKLS